jgi:hypothetical protein
MRLLLGCLWIGVATPAAAQLTEKLADRVVPASVEGTQLTLAFQLAPALGKKQPFSETEDLVDESSSDLSLSVSIPLSDRTRFNVTPGLAYSPQLFDDGDPKSSTYLGARLQTQLGVGPGPTESLRDQITGFVGYKYARGHTDFLGAYVSTDHSFSAGATYQNAMWLYCTRSDCKPDADGNPGGKAGLAFELSPSLSYVGSPAVDRRRWVPGMALKASIPTRFGFSPYASASYEHRAYTDALVAPARKRNDDRLTVDAGITVKVKGNATSDIKVALAGRFQQNWSNLAGESFDRFYLVPSIALETRLR